METEAKTTEPTYVTKAPQVSIPKEVYDRVTDDLEILPAESKEKGTSKKEPDNNKPDDEKKTDDKKTTAKTEDNNNGKTDVKHDEATSEDEHPSSQKKEEEKPDTKREATSEEHSSSDKDKGKKEDEGDLDDLDIEDLKTPEEKLTASKAKIQSILDKNYTDPEKLNELATELTNNVNFKATNTQKSQELSAAKKLLDEQLQRFSKNEELKSIAEQLLKDKDFLEQVDYYDEGTENNRVRKLLNALTQEIQTADEIDTEQSKITQKEAELLVKEETLELREKNPGEYPDKKSLQPLFKIAYEEQVTLPVAHEIKLGRETTAKLTAKEDEIKELKEQLRERNGIIKRLKTDPTASLQPEKSKTNSKGKTPARESYKEPPKSWEEVHNRASKEWDRQMNL